MKKLFLFFMIICANLVIFAQNTKSWKYVGPNDFKIKSPLYSNADAVIISESADYYFDVWREELRLFEEVKRKIKIINKKGLKYAHIEIPYISDDYFEDIILTQAYSYTMNNGKIIKKRLRNRNIHTVKIDKYRSKEIIDIPDVKPGSIIVYRYIIATLKVVSPRRWNFQHSIPCLKSHFEINLPDFINYEFNITGAKNLTLNKREQAYMNLDYIFHYNDPIPAGLGYTGVGFTGHEIFSFQTWNYIFEMRNIPPIKKEKHVDCYCNYKRNISLNLYRIDKNTHLTSNYDIFAWTLLTKRMYVSITSTHHIISKMYSEYTIAPAGFIIYRVKDWKTVNNYMLQNLNFGIQLLKPWKYKQEIDKALNNTDTSKIKKMIDIYNYVKNNYLWNKNYNIFTDKDLKFVAKDKTGNSADINLLLIYLLKKANLKAFPVLIKTIKQGHIDYDLASEQQFNNVIALVKIKNKNYFLDAIQKNTPWYLINKNDLNDKGLIISVKNSNFVKIKPAKTSFFSKTASLNLTDTNNVYCNINCKNFGYFALKIKQDSATIIKNYQKHLKNYNNFSYSFKNLNSDTITQNISFNTSELYKNNKLFPFYIFHFDTDFLSPMRQFPIYYGFDFTKNYTVKIKIPKNKKVFSVPKPFNAQIQGLSISTQIDIDQDQITLNIKIMNNKTLYPQSQYQEMRNLYLQLYNFINTPIIFK